MKKSIIVYDAEGNQIAPKQKQFSSLINSITGKEIAKLVQQIPAFAQVVKDTLPTDKITVILNEHTRELIEEGAKFGNSRFGGMAANLYKNGELVGQAAFSIEQIKEISSNLSTSVNQLMTQLQMGDILASLDNLSFKIERIIAGQQNDRIALYTSAEQLLSEAALISDSETQKTIMMSALQAAHLARGALTQTFIDDVNNMNEYTVSWLGDNYEKDIKPKMQAIKQSIIANYKAAKVCAIVYAAMGELLAMIETLSAFEKLLSSQLPNSVLEKLNSLDSENVGFWIKEPKKMISEIKKLTSSEKTLSIEIPVSLLKGVL